MKLHDKCYVLGTVLSFSDREMALPPSTEINELIFVVNKLKYNNAFRVSFLENRRENLKLNVVLVVPCDQRLNFRTPARRVSS